MRNSWSRTQRANALPGSQDSFYRVRDLSVRKRSINKRRKQHMQKIERQPVGVAQATTVVYPTTPSNTEDARNRAARLAQSADSLIDRILSGDSRAFLDANRQTGGE